MTVAVTAGVFTEERDLSLYAPQLSTAILGVVNTFTKGPVNQRTLITSEDSLTETFGKPSTDSQGWYAAREYLRRSNQLQVVRVGAAGSLAKATIDAVDGGAASTLTFEAFDEGSGWNGYQLVFTAGTGSGRKITIVDPDGITIEIFDNITKANAEANINGISAVVTVTNITGGGPGEPVNQTVTLAAGGDGITGLGDSEVVGTIVGSTRTGLKLLANPEAVDINLIAAPGFASSSVNLELLNISQSRADTLALIDPPFGLSVQEVVDWHNGLAPGDVLYNSSYGALYWAWQQVFDEFAGTNLWTAPSGHVARAMAENDAVAFEWFAPAGFNRGRVISSKATEISPDQGERDLLNGPGNNVNPIVDFVGQGITIWGQKTLQRTPSALDRVNVRRMLLSLRKVVATVAKSLVFEPNDAVTRRQFLSLVTPPLRRIAANRGLTDFLAICDESNNPPSVVDQNRLKGKIFVKPTKTAEIIEVGFITTSQGANFTELVTTS